MTPDDARTDPVLAALSTLPAHDVNEIRADRLRRRCHAVLIRKAAEDAAPRAIKHLPWQRVIGPGIVAAWGALYVAEMLRQAAAIYRP